MYHFIPATNGSRPSRGFGLAPGRESINSLYCDLGSRCVPASIKQEAAYLCLGNPDGKVLGWNGGRPNDADCARSLSDSEVNDSNKRHFAPCRVKEAPVCGGGVVTTSSAPEEEDNTTLYVVGGVAAVVAIGGIAYFATRKKRR